MARSRPPATTRPRSAAARAAAAVCRPPPRPAMARAPARARRPARAAPTPAARPRARPAAPVTATARLGCSATAGAAKPAGPTVRLHPVRAVHLRLLRRRLLLQRRLRRHLRSLRPHARHVQGGDRRAARRAGATAAAPAPDRANGASSSCSYPTGQCRAQNCSGTTETEAATATARRLPGGDHQGVQPVHLRLGRLPQLVHLGQRLHLRQLLQRRRVQIHPPHRRQLHRLLRLHLRQLRRRLLLQQRVRRLVRGLQRGARPMPAGLGLAAQRPPGVQQQSQPPGLQRQLRRLFLELQLPDRELHLLHRQPFLGLQLAPAFCSAGSCVASGSPKSCGTYACDPNGACYVNCRTAPMHPLDHLQRRHRAPPRLLHVIASAARRGRHGGCPARGVRKRRRLRTRQRMVIGTSREVAEIVCMPVEVACLISRTG